MATPVIDPTKKKPYDFSQDALLPEANKGGSAAGMSALAENQMKDRVITESQANPGKLIIGGQTGSLPGIGGSTPVNFQAFTYGNPNPPTPPTGSVSEPADIPEGMGYEEASMEDSGLSDKFAKGYTEWNAPDTSSIDEEISTLYGELDEGKSAQDRLAAEEQMARDKADQEIRRLQQDYENRNAEDFSGLASVGMGVNPLSSGAASVANRNKGIFEKMRQAVLAERDMEINSARARAAGAKLDATGQRISRLENRKKSLHEEALFEYNQRRQALADQAASLTAAAKRAKENKELSKIEQKDARENVKMMFEMLGSKAFEGVADEELRNIEKAAGLPIGTVRAGVQTLREQEINAKNKEEQAKMSDYKFISATKYQPAGYFNPNTGDFIPLKGIGTSGPPRGGGGGGGSTTPKGLAAEAAKARADLASGKADWGNAYNRLKALYPTASNELIDAQLGVEWREPGAYEEFAKEQQSFRGKPSEEDDEEIY